MFVYFSALLPTLPCLPPTPLHSSLKPFHRPFSPFYSFLCPAQRLMQFQNSFMFQIYFCTRIFGLMCPPVWPAMRPKCIFLYCCRCYFNCHVSVTAEKYYLDCIHSSVTASEFRDALLILGFFFRLFRLNMQLRRCT